jgi:hypothetical protein
VVLLRYFEHSGGQFYVSSNAACFVGAVSDEIGGRAVFIGGRAENVG